MKRIIFVLLLLGVKGALGQVKDPTPRSRPTSLLNEKIKLITADKAGQHIGDSVRVADSVYSTRFLSGNTPITFLNLGGNYPKQKLTIVIRGASRQKFPVAPEEAYKGKYISVSGKITEYKGRPQIVVFDPMQIQLMEKVPGREMK